MPSKVLSCALSGLECSLIEVEADLTPTQLGNFVVVGLPDTAVQESRERIRLAIKNSGFQFPTKRISVNLAPADIKKQGPSFDVPIALAIMLATLKEPPEHLQCSLDDTVVIGELALDGAIRSAVGVLPMVLAAKAAGIKHAFVPATNAQEAAMVHGITIYPITHLRDVLHGFCSTMDARYVFERYIVRSAAARTVQAEYDMSSINGQEHAKRVLEIAAAGGHNVLFNGPPGSGKTMLARALPGILPQLSHDEALEVTAIYSASGQLRSAESIQLQRPFRSPHHTASGVALIGGGTLPKPGELSLAHKGVLFLDELPEFPRSILEYLRQPLEEGVITVSRAAGTWTFPAACMLIAAMNPCPCGFYLDEQKPCTCSPSAVLRYQQRLSGPLLDRIDLFCSVPRVSYETLTTRIKPESSSSIRSRVEAARIVQSRRFGAAKTNARMSATECKRYCGVDQATDELLQAAVDSLQLSARSYYRVLRLARTIADLEESEKIQHEHVAESLQYRSQQ